MLVLLLAAAVPAGVCAAQEPDHKDLVRLPDAPRPQGISERQNSASQQAGTANVSGTVLDKNGNVVKAAEVTLTDSTGSAARRAESGDYGQFKFTGLKADVYKLTVTAPGMKAFTSRRISLHAGEFRILPTVVLSVAPVSTTVVVNAGTKEQLSKEQLHISVHQRIGGVIPNFYTSYDWKAPPMLAKQKFQLSLRSLIDPVSLVSVASLAGVQQYQNAFPDYGGGMQGYGKRFGAAMANHVSAVLLGKAVYPSIFHQDPRYFYKGRGSIASRVLHAISSAVIARGDNGHWEPNYSRVLGHFSAAAISNLYYPLANRGGSLVVYNSLAGIGENAVANLVREFLPKSFTSHAPK